MKRTFPGVADPVGADGLLAGDPKQLGVQVLACVVSAVYAAVVTYGVLELTDKLVGLRVPTADSVKGSTPPSTARRARRLRSWVSYRSESRLIATTRSISIEVGALEVDGAGASVAVTVPSSSRFSAPVLPSSRSMALLSGKI